MEIRFFLKKIARCWYFRDTIYSNFALTCPRWCLKQTLFKSHMWSLAWKKQNKKCNSWFMEMIGGKHPTLKNVYYNFNGAFLRPKKEK